MIPISDAGNASILYTGLATLAVGIVMAVMAGAAWILKRRDASARTPLWLGELFAGYLFLVLVWWAA